MSFSKASILTIISSLLTHVSAHGFVSGLVADGKYFQGYSPVMQYQNPPPAVAGWSDPKDLSNGFVSDYTSPDIICHLSATPGQAYATVAAGGTVDLQWTPWPESHHGPMISYLANCNGECTTVDKTALKWNKIDEAGLIDGSIAPGKWGSDQMIANNNTWSLKIPSSIAAGKYVLRHETIALHSAESIGGAQNYPQCVNLEITGGGSDTLTGGTVGTSLYTASDPGILINIYQSLSQYVIPGPKLISDAGSSSGGGTGSGTSSTSTSVSTSTSTSVSTSTSTSVSTSTSTSVSTSTSTSVSTSTSTSVSTSCTSSVTTSGRTTLQTVTGRPKTSITASSSVTTSIAAASMTTYTAADTATMTTYTATDTATMTTYTTTDTASSPFSASLPNKSGTPKKFVCYEVN